jgi:threonine dehydratase
MEPMPTLPTLEDVRAAARRIAPYTHRTPIVVSRTFDDELDATVFFKCENLQKVGAFKARGATNAVMRLEETAARRGVVTHSSGNHGAALAYAAGMRGIPCVVVMPTDAPETKVRAVRGYGAEIVLVERQAREETARRLVAERRLELIHPFEHPDVVAGQGTAALELLDQVGELDVLIAPVGGGGLLSGSAITLAALAPRTDVWGAEPEVADDARRSLESGVHQPAVESPRSWSDGLLTRLGTLAFEVLRGARARIVPVSEKETLRAAWDVAQRMKLVVEPSGATVLAALRSCKEELGGRRVGAIFSGGNTDFAWLADPTLQRE